MNSDIKIKMDNILEAQATIGAVMGTCCMDAALNNMLDDIRNKVFAVRQAGSCMTILEIALLIEEAAKENGLPGVEVDFRTTATLTIGDRSYLFFIGKYEDSLFGVHVRSF